MRVRSAALLELCRDRKELVSLLFCAGGNRRGGRGRGGFRGASNSSFRGRGRGRGGRGGGRGRGRGRNFGGKKKTKEELDAEMDAYFLKDAKTAVTRLDADLDEYFALKDKAKAATESVTAGTISTAYISGCLVYAWLRCLEESWLGVS